MNFIYTFPDDNFLVIFETRKDFFKDNWVGKLDKQVEKFQEIADKMIQEYGKPEVIVIMQFLGSDGRVFPYMSCFPSLAWRRIDKYNRFVGLVFANDKVTHRFNSCDKCKADYSKNFDRFKIKDESYAVRFEWWLDDDSNVKEKTTLFYYNIIRGSGTFSKEEVNAKKMNRRIYILDNINPDMIKTINIDDIADIRREVLDGRSILYKPKYVNPRLLIARRNKFLEDVSSLTGRSEELLKAYSDVIPLPMNRLLVRDYAIEEEIFGLVDFYTSLFIDFYARFYTDTVKEYNFKDVIRMFFRMRRREEIVQILREKFHNKIAFSILLMVSVLGVPVNDPTARYIFTVW